MNKVPRIIGVLALSLFVFSACSVSVSTASLGDVKLCETPNAEGMCEENITSFSATAQTINATVILNNAPAETLVRSEWWQNIEPPNKIDEVSYNTKEGENVIFFNLTSAGSGFPPGDYEFKAYINADATPKTVKYTIE